MSEPEPRYVISAVEATAWWRRHEPAGAFFNRLWLAFIGAPIVLVVNDYFRASVIVFSLIVPYGFLVRYLAVIAVRRRLAREPESLSEFRDSGVVVG
ncbi:MAG TPA: hypothetical protein VFY29_09190 [Terriglobia bacterium]|nr:hypothetical protein [Terriglobia bacterium]